MDNQNRPAGLTLPLAFAAVFGYYVFLQFISPTLYEVDSHYHVAVAQFIKTWGLHYHFLWARFSTFTKFYADKELLFHLGILPFLLVTKNIVLAGKLAVLFYDLLFLGVFVFILRRYVSRFAAACVLLLLVFCNFFSMSMLFLRPATLANVFTLAAIYLLIKKRWLWLGILSLLYPMAHLSFFTVIIFALICESIRWAFEKQACARNIYAAVLGTALGLVLHPDFPNNLLVIYLNDFLVPLYSLTSKISLGGEFSSYSLRHLLIINFPVFLSLGVVFWTGLVARVKASFPTLVWGACAFFYLLLACVGNRYWYPATAVFFVFFTAWLGDWRGERSWNQVSVKLVRHGTLAFLIVVAVSLPASEILRRDLKYQIDRNVHHEDIARWMVKLVPAGETIYHSHWDDSPVFICLNPKNSYFVVLDPIYMYYPFPDQYKIYQDIREGRLSRPDLALTRVFNTRYGYVRVNTGLSSQILKDREHFKILYANRWGLIFRVIEPVAEVVKENLKKP